MKLLKTARDIFLLICIGVIGYWIYQILNKPEVPNVIEKLRLNYEEDIDLVSAEMDLPSEYFKALVILESSATKPAKTRFEPHVYRRLSEVKAGTSERYGQFTTAQMEVLSDNTLRKLATSWGPLQVMGYHCIPMGITVEQLQGPDAIRYSLQWAEKAYGKYLKAGDFKNAFHIHNTGQKFPTSGEAKTTDPNYIPKGLDYIDFFKNNP